MTHLLIQADARKIPLADGSIHAVITSPPYFGLRDYKVRGQIGLERTPSEYVAELVRAFREVWRVLRDDGTLWLNIGDSYSSGGRVGHGTRVGYMQSTNRGANDLTSPTRPPCASKPKDLLGIPWMLAFALRDDGWYLRSEIIWHKRNPMPDSTDDRPTRSHEQVFLFTKKPRYYYDGFAVQENSVYKGSQQSQVRGEFSGKGGAAPGLEPFRKVSETRNRRSVWSLTSENYRGSHFAVMPSKLAVPMVKAGTSERGACPMCGAPWERVVERTAMKLRRSERTHKFGHTRSSGTMLEPPSSKTIGWRPTCAHDAAPVPCRVFDPFAGSGTTLVVAEALGRVGIGCDLSSDYLAQARRRIERPHQPLTKQREQALPLFAHMEDA